MVVDEALRGGVDIVQLRDYELVDLEFLKLAKVFRELTRRYGALFIVNNRPDMARLSEADGVHLGQEDLPVSEARKILGEGKIVGVSTHALGEARKALSDGADYLGAGPVFPTPTKAGRPAVTLEYPRQMAALNSPVPFFAIGGIDLGNLSQVLDAGARRVAVVRAIAGASNPREAAGEFKKILLNRLFSVA